VREIMGEAIYYLKAHFPGKITWELKQQLTAFVREGQAANEWWREHRGCPTPEAFWERFVEKFPTIAEYLGSLVGGNCDNALAGVLDFGEEYDLDALEFDGTEFRYHCTCWHFASWNPFAAFLRSKFGAIRVNWMSDEYMDPFDAL